MALFRQSSSADPPATNAWYIGSERDEVNGCAPSRLVYCHSPAAVLQLATQRYIQPSRPVPLRESQRPLPRAPASHAHAR
jgi:hypothetical protein